MITFFTIISKILGLLRDRLLASYFGAGSLLDSYYAAFKLPDLIFNTLVLGALASAFIPVFTRVWCQDKIIAVKLANSIFNYLIAAIICLSSILYFTAPWLIPIITPGFNQPTMAQTINFTRIMLLSIVFFTASNVIGGILNSLKKFFSFSLAPVFYNLGIILGIVILYPIFGPAGLSWGVVFGSILHFLIQLPEAICSGWRYHWIWHISPDVKKIFKLMIPRTVGLIAGQINQMVITAIASTLAIGSIAVFNLANNLQSLPTSILGVSLAIAIFPVFSEALARHDHDHFVQTFSLNFRRLIFLIVPISVLILLLRAQLVRIILGFGNFDWQDTYYTAQTLGWFSISLFAQCLTPMLARSFYALEDTKTPVYISITVIAINIVGSIFFSRAMGVEGLALAYSLAAIINMLMLLFFLRIKVGYLDDKKIVISVIKTGINSFLAGSVIYLMLQIMAYQVNMRTFFGIFTQGLIAGLAGIFIYFILSLIINCEEIIIVKKFLQRYFKLLFRHE